MAFEIRSSGGTNNDIHGFLAVKGAGIRVVMILRDDSTAKNEACLSICCAECFLIPKLMQFEDATFADEDLMPAQEPRQCCQSS